MDGQTHRSRMENKKLTDNAQVLQLEMQRLHQWIEARISHYFGHSDIAPDLDNYPPLEISEAPYSQFIAKHQMTTAERLILNLAIMPHIRSQYLDLFLTRNKLTGNPFTEFGGIVGKNHCGFLPTIETALFILAAESMRQRFELLALFEADHFFYKNNILQLGSVDDNEPQTSRTLNISQEYLLHFTSASTFSPSYNTDFPATRLDTALEWEDLVLDPSVQDEVEAVNDWMEHQQMIMEEWQLGRVLKRGFRVLFYGPPGTGKTLTASLIGKVNKMAVYRVDLSQIVSKYIGETEKNLARVFDLAEGRNWILFFDEADALFGQRTSNQSANDRHSNQEIAYLLQRIEDFLGLVILATNLKGNIDEAFARRFQAMINFKMPDAEQRLQLWKNAFANKPPLSDEVDLVELADKYELAGGSIINVLRHAALTVARLGLSHVRQYDLLEGIRRELRKTGQFITG